ncbi:NAD(P)-dependent alcohol dehydrogenase [Agromyces allii]|uniref:NAD(P)-dependent alcohol dehydrogenase n=1 Tax=Agromyces allii TaxID=393607 RepID=A0ABN2QBZ2_9MICO|nr:NAD(P)-dependent alcohol dehydrogenase [Agromyces allii]
MNETKSDTQAAGRPTTTAMRAVAQRRYGGPEVLALETVTAPVPKADEVLVAVHAVDVASGDVRVMRGEPKLMRAIFGLRRPRVPTVGRDIAGTVAAVGSSVTGFAVGDRVCGEVSQGGWAEYAALPARFAVRVPDAVGFADAATLPVSAGTALQGLRLAGIDPAQPVAASGERPRLLVIGASGGVGGFAVQLAALAGWEVVGVASAAKGDHVRALGADRVLDYASPWAEAEPDGAYDAVFDLAGAQSLSRLARLARRGGTVVLSAGGGDGLLGPIPRLLGAMLRGPFMHASLKPLAAARSAEDLEALVALLADGRIRPMIDRIVPLADVQSAVRAYLAGEIRGKLVLSAR